MPSFRDGHSGLRRFSRETTSGLSSRAFRLRGLPALTRVHRLLLARDLRGMQRSRRSLCQIHMLIYRTFTGATGLETATSGVTGRSWRLRAERGSAGIPA